MGACSRTAGVVCRNRRSWSEAGFGGRELKWLRRAASTLGIAHTVLRWDGPKPATGLQDAAREARYRLLAQEAAQRGCTVLLTAHTRDDQAETLLMRMAHGSGPKGLVGMKRRSSRGPLTLVRPLLDLPKARLIATVRAHELPSVTDPSNEDTRFERVRWRQLMPTLEAAGLSAERLAVLAQRLARLEAAIAPQVEALHRTLQAEAGINATMLFAEPDEISLRVLARLVLDTNGAGGPLRLERLEQCHQALREAAATGAALRRTLAGCVLSLDRSGRLTLRPEAPRRRGIHPATS